MTQPGNRLVIDASAIVALLVDPSPVGEWVRTQVEPARLHAPHVVRFEVANALRQNQIRGILAPEDAIHAHRRLLQLAVTQTPYSFLARRAWELAPNLTIYDAAYVALAELLEAPLLTLDQRLARAPGVECEVLAYAGA